MLFIFLRNPLSSGIRAQVGGVASPHGTQRRLSFLVLSITGLINSLLASSVWVRNQDEDWSYG